MLSSSLYLCCLHLSVEFFSPLHWYFVGLLLVPLFLTLSCILDTPTSHLSVAIDSRGLPTLPDKIPLSIHIHSSAAVAHCRHCFRRHRSGWTAGDGCDFCLLLPFGVEQNISLSACVSKILTDILFYVRDIPQSMCTICGTNLIKWCQ